MQEMGGGQGDQVRGTLNDQPLRERGAGHHQTGECCVQVWSWTGGAWNSSYRENEVLSWGSGGMEGPGPPRVSTELSKGHIHFHPAIPLGSQVSATFISG